jgi:hypothetical protein
MSRLNRSIFATSVIMKLLQRGRQPASQLLAALRHVRQASGVPQRDPRFASVTDTDVQFFETVLGPGGGVVTDPHELQPFNK